MAKDWVSEKAKINLRLKNKETALAGTAQWLERVQGPEGWQVQVPVKG